MEAKTIRKVVKSLKEDAHYIVVREFVTPYLACLEPQEVNGYLGHVNQEQFFAILRQHRSEASEPFPNDAEATFIWKEIVEMIEELLSGTKQDVFSSRDELPEGHVSFTQLRMLSALGLDGVVTGQAQRDALKEMLDTEVKRTGNLTITRNDFVVSLTHYEDKLPAIKTLDYEPLAFYLFPDEAMNITILKRLIDMTHSPPIKHSFITTYSEIKTSQSRDMIDLLWFLPFLILYLAVSFSSKGMTPRSYNGFGVYQGVQKNIAETDFKECSRDANNTLTCAAGTKMKLNGVKNADQLYGFLHEHIATLLWPSTNGTSAEHFVSNSLRTTGALKIRQQRVKGEVSSSYTTAFFGPSRTKALHYAPYATDKIDTATIDAMAGDPLIAPVVLQPWDGSRYGSCGSLNASATIDGLNKQYSCDGHAMIIPFNTTQAQFRQVIVSAANKSWIDEATRAVFVEAFLFHEDSGFFVSMVILFEFQAGGAVTTSIEGAPFFFHDPFSHSTGIDVAYFIFIVYLGILIFRMVFGLFFSANKKEAKWLILDAINFFTFFVSIVVRLLWLAEGRPDDPVWQLNYFPRNDRVASRYNAFVTIDAFNAIMSTLAVFRYTKFVPGLDNVVNTLQRSVVQGVVIAFITVITLFGFAICASIVFGETLLGYQTVNTAASSLMLVFWGDFDYTVMHKEQPTFAFLFFGLFNIMLIAVLMSAVIAVFADAFDEEQSQSFRPESLRSILVNNPHHVFDSGSITDRIRGFTVVQLVAAYYRRVRDLFRQPHERDGLTYDVYDAKLASYISALLLPHIKNASTKRLPTVAERLHAAASILRIINQFVIVPDFEPASGAIEQRSTSIFEYAEHLFGNRLDYVLVLTLYVLVPQQKFTRSGVSQMVEAARAQKRWMENVEDRSVRISDEEMLMLRVTSASFMFKSKEGMTREEAFSVTRKGKQELALNLEEELVKSLNYLSRRVLLGLLAGADPSHFVEGAVLTRERFNEICRATPNYPIDTYSPDTLYGDLGVSEFVTRSEEGEPRMDRLHGLAQREYAMQCLSFNFSQNDMQNMEAAVRVVSGVTVEAISTPTSTLKQLTHHSFEMSDGGESITTAQFVDAWRNVKGHAPSEKILERVSSIFLDKKIDMGLFFHYCRGNPLTHRCRSFAAHFAASMSNYSKFLAWSSFYIPFVVIVVFLVLYGFNLGETVHVTSALRDSFAPQDVLTRDSVVTYVKGLVEKIWPDPKEPANIHSLSNYYVGALRLRQHRVTPIPKKDCEDFYKAFINPDSLDGIAFPASMSANTRAFYTDRIQRDYYATYNGICLEAYNLGIYQKKNDISVPATVSPAVAKAFRFVQEKEGTETAAHDSTYPHGGFTLDIPYTVNGSVARSYVNELMNNNWIDNSTRFVIAEISIFNYNLDVYAHARMGVEMTSGGVINPINRLAATPSRPVPTVPLAIASIFMWALVIVYLLLILRESMTVIQSRVRYYFDHPAIALAKAFREQPYFVVDLGIVSIFIASWVWRLTVLGQLRIDTIDNNGEYSFLIEKTCARNDLIRKVEGSNIFFLSIRFLHILSFNSRINVLFQTFVVAFEDLLSVFVLFIVALFAFAFGGNLLFGYYVNNYFNIQNAFFDLFSTAMGGPPSFLLFYPFRRNVAVIYQVLFVTVCMFIIYNMVIAVLTGALSEVKAGIFDDAKAREVMSQGGRYSGGGSLWFRFRRAVRSAFVVRELLHFFTFIRCIRSGRTLGQRCISTRALWNNVAEWWDTVDTSPPRDAALSGLNIMALTSEVRAEKDSSYAAVGVTGIRTNLSNIRADDEEGFEYEIINDHIMRSEPGAATEEPLFSSYGQNRRLPIWTEFLFSKFGSDYGLLRRHLVMTPAHLQDYDDDSIWLQALEIHHDFTADRDLYIVDTDGSILVDMYFMLPDINDTNKVADAADSPQKRTATFHVQANVAGFAADAPRRSITFGSPESGILPSPTKESRELLTGALVGHGVETAQSDDDEDGDDALHVLIHNKNTAAEANEANNDDDNNLVGHPHVVGAAPIRQDSHSHDSHTHIDT